MNCSGRKPRHSDGGVKRLALPLVAGFYHGVCPNSGSMQGGVDPDSFFPAPIEVTQKVSFLVEDTTRVGGQLVRGGALTRAEFGRT